MIEEILNGWGNYIKDEFNLISPDIKKIAVYRLKLCHNCVLRSNNFCDRNRSAINIITKKLVNGCGCNLAAKTLSTHKNTKCPMGKW